jgi:hypothetical protein
MCTLRLRFETQLQRTLVCLADVAGSEHVVQS